ncbi:hypothetical protein TX23_01155 [Pseudomonas paralactis]|uniref:Uncharacterized protein n=1 Tax=Pseudomonas paralactis TaxID=1615673 RepID=A0A0R3AP47_9PSED|nr:hypothetical protein [Pseudomonas paralactis]KRP74826.1 hypothetical protein TX23_01155 [Pseudomonas paralactis]
MFEKIKETIKHWSRTAEEDFRLKFEGKHDDTSITRLENGTYADPAVEAEWQIALKDFNAEEYEKFIDNQW